MPAYSAAIRYFSLCSVGMFAMKGACRPMTTIFWLGTSSPDYLSGTTVDVNNGSYPR